MEASIKCNQQWIDLKKYLEIYGDFVLKCPLLTDEVIGETEEEIFSMDNSERTELSVERVKLIFNEKMDERIIYEESDDMTEIYKDIFVDEEKDAIIKDVISKMVADIRKRRNYE